jgi:uncharacterized membrane protein YeaQ/YmgE (transglycosylase-associated protein family)
MGILSWVVLGALAGWISGRFLGEEKPQGCLANIVIGVGGALVGGAIITIVTGEDYMFRFNLPSLVVAVLGALILVNGLRLIGGRGR